MNNFLSDAQKKALKKRQKAIKGKKIDYSHLNKLMKLAKIRKEKLERENNI